MNRSSRLLVCLVAITLSAGLTAKNTEEMSVLLKPEAHFIDATRNTTTFLSSRHYRPTKLDDQMSSMILDRYIKSLDGGRIYLTARDIKFFEAYRTTLDDAMRNSDLSPAYDLFNIYSQRVNERMDYALEVLDREFDFKVDEELELDRRDLDWAESEAELNDIWRKRVKNDVLRLRLTDKDDDSIRELLAKRYTDQKNRVAQLDAEDVFQLYLNSYALSIEPHTSYLAPRASDNFNIAMRLSLEGIGAVLQQDGEYTVIRTIVTGGPADMDGTLKVGDRIIGVGQGSDEIVDVRGWRLDDVVALIRGNAGTRVHLDVLPGKSGLDGEIVAIDLIRDKVKLEESAAKSDIYEFKNDEVSYKVGVIDLPAFYHDFAAHERGEPDYRSSTRDTKRLIQQLKAEGVDAIIVDVRGNGGGSLTEATDLTGLFIESGPVVQVKDSRGRIDINADRNKTITWEGPLAVLVDRNSASASEIFAAAIQDYGRGVVIGEPTFGKGTVQHLINLDQNQFRRSENRFGQLKLTVAQFFRINGGSTQNRGVIPDIVFPTAIEDADYGESSLDNALPWSSIKPARYEIYQDMTDVLIAVNDRSTRRVKEDPEFQFLLEDIRLFKEAQDKTTVSLLESKRREQLREDEDRRQKRKDLLKSLSAQVEADSVTKLTDEEDRSDTLAEIAAALPVEDETEDGDVREEDEDDLPQSDIMLEESIRIISDMIGMTANRMTASNVKPKEQGSSN